MSDPTPTLADLSSRLADAVAAAGAGVLGLEIDGHAHSAVAWTADLAVTVAGPLSPEASLVVHRPDGSEVPATLVGVDPRLDLAMLRIAGLAPTPRTDGATLRPGDLALTVGRTARGLTATMGAVSSTGPAWTTAGGARVARYLALDASLPAVSVGGALVDAAGRIVGVNTPGLVVGGTTVPADTVDEAVAFLLEHGSVRPGLLGVRVRTVAVPPDVAAAEGVHRALQVIGVPRGGAADRAGIETGDVLLTIDGEAVGSLGDLRAALSTRGGQPVQVRRLRAGALDTVAVTPSTQPPRGGGPGPWWHRHGHEHHHHHGGGGGQHGGGCGPGRRHHR